MRERERVCVKAAGGGERERGRAHAKVIWDAKRAALPPIVANHGTVFFIKPG